MDSLLLDARPLIAINVFSLKRPTKWTPELGLGDHILVPDLAGWKRERFPVIEINLGDLWLENLPASGNHGTK
jgi:hypothetical protein